MVAKTTRVNPPALKRAPRQRREAPAFRTTSWPRATTRRARSRRPRDEDEFPEDLRRVAEIRPISRVFSIAENRSTISDSCERIVRRRKKYSELESRSTRPDLGRARRELRPAAPPLIGRACESAARRSSQIARYFLVRRESRRACPAPGCGCLATGCSGLVPRSSTLERRLHVFLLRGFPKYSVGRSCRSSFLRGNVDLDILEYRSSLCREAPRNNVGNAMISATIRTWSSTKGTAPQ